MACSMDMFSMTMQKSNSIACSIIRLHLYFAQWPALPNFVVKSEVAKEKKNYVEVETIWFSSGTAKDGQFKKKLPYVMNGKMKLP